MPIGGRLVERVSMRATHELSEAGTRRNPVICTPRWNPLLNSNSKRLPGSSRLGIEPKTLGYTPTPMVVFDHLYLDAKLQVERDRGQRRKVRERCMKGERRTGKEKAGSAEGVVVHALAGTRGPLVRPNRLAAR